MLDIKIYILMLGLFFLIGCSNDQITNVFWVTYALSSYIWKNLWYYSCAMLWWNWIIDRMVSSCFIFHCLLELEMKLYADYVIRYFTSNDRIVIDYGLLNWYNKVRKNVWMHKKNRRWADYESKKKNIYAD